LIAAASAFLLACPLSAATFLTGDLVRLNKGETLMFMGKNLLPAPKGQEFTVLKHDPRQNIAFVGFYKEDGSLIAVTLPGSSLELAPPSAWQQIARGLESFRDGGYEDARRFLALGGREPAYRSIAGVLTAKITGAVAASSVARTAEGARASSARQSFSTALQGLRDTSAQLCELGLQSAAWPLEEGTDRLGALVFGSAAAGELAAGIPPSKIDRADAMKRATDSNRCVARCRQAMALHRMYEASKYLKEGLASEPARPELKEFKVLVQKDLDDADENFHNADRMRRFADGTPHALTAMEHGLKSCADHPGLLGLRREMQGAFEERTAPPVTAALLAAAKTGGAQEAAEEGRKLYTERCTECHDLELLDSRSLTTWDKMVSSMSGRAHLTDNQKARIMEYLTVAWNGISQK
jgi:hypothetical protein